MSAPERNTAETPALLDVRAVARMCSVHRATIYRKVASGELPPPIDFLGRSLWRRAEIEAAIERAASARDDRAA